MSLNARERRSLAAIEEDLLASAPELESLLAMFNGLTVGEDMPAHARMRPPRLRRPRRGRHRLRTRRHQQAGRSGTLQRWWLGCLALWVIFFVGMVATAVALSSAGPQLCPSVPAAACRLAQAHGPHPASVKRL